MKNRIVRRLAMVILCVMTFTVVYSQAESHVQFMGIPINGSADYFCAQLLKKGFVKEGNHYTGDVKPWHKESRNPYTYKYYEYLKLTPWKEYKPLFKHRTLKAMIVYLAKHGAKYLLDLLG